MKKQLKKHIRSAVKGRILFDEPMASRTSFSIGGPAEVWVEPENVSSLAETIRFSKKKGIPLTVIGAGSNVLVRDKGLRGIVVSLSSVHFKIIDRTGEQSFRVSSGVKLHKLLKITRNNGLGGLEFIVGIPGTLGGAIIMNAGGKDKNISDLVTKVDLMDRSGELVSLDRRDINFGYRFSGLDDYVILGAHLHLQKRPQDLIDRDISNYSRLKKSFQELKLPNAGSIFKNPGHLAFSAGRLIELSGLKGKTIGNIQVSTKHANFIVNRGGGRARDVMKLIELVRRKIKKDHNVDLELELKVIG